MLIFSNLIIIIIPKTIIKYLFIFLRLILFKYLQYIYTYTFKSKYVTLNFVTIILITSPKDIDQLKNIINNVLSR